MIYFKYFFTGYRQPGMSPAMLTYVDGARRIVLIVFAYFAQLGVNAATHSTYQLDPHVLTAYGAPAAYLILNGVWKFLREANNPYASVVAALDSAVGQQITSSGGKLPPTDV